MCSFCGSGIGCKVFAPYRAREAGNSENLDSVRGLYARPSVLLDTYSARLGSTHVILASDPETIFLFSEPHCSLNKSENRANVALLVLYLGLEESR